jgi:hypothetical protein
LDYEDFRDFFYRRNPECRNTIGKLYNSVTGEIKDLRCKKYSCPSCRAVKQQIVYLETLRNVYNFDLQRHFVITFEGKKFRDKYTWIESYKYMAKFWDLYRKVIEYHYGKIDYILFARAQKSGYCHYHILLNKSVPWGFLNEKRKKYGLGFVSIQKNKDVAEYLHTDYWHDTEWIIPGNVRHYRTSRGIILNNFKADENFNFVTDKTLLENLKILFGGIPDFEDYAIERKIFEDMQSSMDPSSILLSKYRYKDELELFFNQDFGDLNKFDSGKRHLRTGDVYKL